jgi:hypothetical protein
MPNGLRKPIFIKSFLPLLIGIGIFRPGPVNALDTRSYPKAAPAPAAAQAKSADASAPLDQKGIHAAYGEGDFERVIAAIDSFTQANKTYSQGDSVFIAKHLAVIYTANPATREKGKNYMFRLLNLLPSAKIVDMFVSDEIDHIFEKVREEYVVRKRMTGQDAPSHQESNQYAVDKLAMQRKQPSGSAGPAASEATGKSAHTSYWIAGGVAALAVAGAAYYFMNTAEPSDKIYDVP